MKEIVTQLRLRNIGGIIVIDFIDMEAPEARDDRIAPAVNPYNWQDHLYDKNQPENLEFLRRFRSVMDEFDAVAVGEVGDAQYGLEIQAEYTSGGDKVQMCYSFEFLSGVSPTAERVGEVLFSPSFEEQNATELAQWILEDHLPVRMQLQLHKLLWGSEQGR